MSITIILHQGTTCLLSKPEIVGDHTYPFAFDATTPEQKSWSWRLLPQRDPARLTDEKFIQLLKAGRPVWRADWEEQVGHIVGMVTLYPPSGSGDKPCKVEFEKGPDLEMTPPKPKSPNPVPPPVEPEPEPDTTPDIF
jgi:hypothetical protein